MISLGLRRAEWRLYEAALSAKFNEPEPPEPGDDEESDRDEEPTTPEQPDPQTGPADPFRIVSANVKWTMSRKKIHEDYKKVAGLGSLILWQEVKGQGDDALKQHLPARDWHHICINRGTPITAKKAHWDVVQAAAYKMHDKKTRAPARYVTVALLRLKGTGVEVLVCNSHFTAHAWCGHSRADKQWRKNKWNLHYDKFQSLVNDARSKGITVLMGGDWNKRDVPKFNAAQVWFRNYRLDYLAGLEAPGGATFNVQSTQAVGLNSDHNAQIAQLQMTAGSNSLHSSYRWGGL